jgi:hypothetical protein
VSFVARRGCWRQATSVRGKVFKNEFLPDSRSLYSASHHVNKMKYAFFPYEKGIFIDIRADIYQILPDSLLHFKRINKEDGLFSLSIKRLRF